MKFLKTTWLPVLLLPAVHTFHSYIDHYKLIDGGSAAFLTLILLIFSLAAWWMAHLFCKDHRRSALITAAFSFLFFYFGVIQDFIQRYTSFPYRISLPAFGLFFLLICVLILKRKAGERIFIFLNTLLIIFILIDLARWPFKNIEYDRLRSVVDIPTFSTHKKTGSLPDIYLIICDEYAGKESLRKEFGFDNGPFADSLTARDFEWIDSSAANYNSTPYSVASLLNMGYLADIKKDHHLENDLNHCYKALNEAALLQFLMTKGYSFRNLSLFTIAGQSPGSQAIPFLPKTTDILLEPTLYGRLRKDLYYHLIQKFGWTGTINQKQRDYNENTLEAISEQGDRQSKAPIFTYGHLLIPHYPYYFNALGQAFLLDSVQLNHDNQIQYIQYLQYGNQQLLQLIDRLPSNALVILMGDHGFRQWTTPPSDSSSLYNNFKAVRLPGLSADEKIRLRSNVNVFRVILNKYFEQDLPILKDSTVLVRTNE